jgi:hypothetical protein
MTTAIEREVDAVGAMVRRAEAAAARQRRVVEQLQQAGGASPLSKLELRVLEDILRRHRERLRSLTAAEHAAALTREAEQRP